MAARRVTHTRKDINGNICALCNPNASWSSVSLRVAIRDIETGRHRYFVRRPGGERVDIHVVPGSTGTYLRTDRDRAVGNNLGDLPDC